MNPAFQRVTGQSNRIQNNLYRLLESKKLFWFWITFLLKNQNWTTIKTTLTVSIESWQTSLAAHASLRRYEIVKRLVIKGRVMTSYGKKISTAHSRESSGAAFCWDPVNIRHTAFCWCEKRDLCLSCQSIDSKRYCSIRCYARPLAAYIAQGLSTHGHQRRALGKSSKIVIRTWKFQCSITNDFRKT